jgi:hypothetical protein
MARYASVPVAATKNRSWSFLTAGSKRGPAAVVTSRAGDIELPASNMRAYPARRPRPALKPAATCPDQPTTAQVVVAFFAGSLSEVAVSLTWPRWAPPVACLA